MSQDRATSEPIAPRPNLERRRAAFHRKRLSPPDRRRARDLFLAFMARIEPARRDTVVEADALEVAELTVGCETIRADLDAIKLQGLTADALTGTLKHKANLVNAVTRLQSTKDRARRALLKSVPGKPIPRLMQNLARKPNA
jgi:hypothetical protein